MSRKNRFQRHYPFVQFFGIALLVATVNLAATAQSPNSFSVSIENFGDQYYRGTQPDEVGFTELKRLGIKTIIDLREDSQEQTPLWARLADLQYFNIPLTTKRPATEEQTASFLKLVNDTANWPVYVHCKGGRHRTGEMTAIYRITNGGWTADQAYQEMKRYDFEDSFFYPKSLKKYVYAYYQRYAADKAANQE
jgi:protein tyrosine/serine phosphatase